MARDFAGVRIPVYCINLDRRPDRWAAISARATELGMEITRLTAIDAANPGPLPGEDKMRRNGRLGPLTRPVIACTLSHVRAWEQIVASGAEWGIVLEDDVVISAEFRSVIAALVSHAKLPGLLKFETPRNRRGRLYSRREFDLLALSRHLRRVVDFSNGAAGYLMRRDVAERAVNTIHQANVPVDHFLFEPAGRRGELGEPFLLLDPGLVLQEDGGKSDLDAERWAESRFVRRWRGRLYWSRADIVRYLSVLTRRTDKHQFTYLP